MSREKEFAKNTGILAIGRYLPKLFSLVTLPIITAKLTKTEYGTYDLIVTLVSLLLPAVTLQIQSAAFRFLIDHRGNDKGSSQIISNIFFFTVLTSIITVVIFYFVYGGVSVATKLLICVYFFIDIMQLVLGMSARGLGYNSVYSTNAVINSAVNAALIFLLIYIGDWGLNGVLIATITAYLVATAYMAIKIKIYKYIHLTSISFPLLKEMLAYSWPMVPNNLSNWILRLSDRLVISTVLGVEANAIYAVANKIPNLLSDAQAVVVMGWQENASIAANDEDSSVYYSSMFHYMFDIVFSLTCLLIAAMPVIFAILIQGDYDEAYVQIPILMIGMFFYCMCGFLGGIYVAYKKTLSVAITTISAAAINLIIDIFFVGKIGITAGSVSTLAAYLALFLFRMFDLKRWKNMNYSYRRILLQMLVFVGLCILAARQNLVCNIINVVVAVVVVYVLEKDLVKSLLSKAIKKIKGRKK